MKQNGLTLIEVLVALVISTILLGGMIAMFDATKKSYAVQTEIARLQDNARFVMEDLGRELRNAGYFGCSGIPPAGDSTNLFPEFSEISTGSFPKSNSITINSFNQQLRVNDTSLLLGDTTILLSSDNDMWPVVGEEIIVSDCDSSERYTVASPAPTATNLTLNLGSGLSRNYSISIQPEVFMGATKVSYKIDDLGNSFTLNKCYDNDNDDVYCEAGEITQLLEGVEALQIRFGLDTDTVKDNIPNKFSASIGAGEKVVAIRMALLMRTPSKRYDLRTTNKSFQLLSGAYNPQDNEQAEKGYRHQFFTNTISLLNIILN